MPCNALNHPPDCNCGWGGVYHPESGSMAYGPGYWSRDGSYSNPNAKCPVCGASVFFYRSPDNGRVFFDSPGPPWPKHPCTSGAQQRPSRVFSGFNLAEGWFPFPCKAILSVDDGKAVALINTQDRTLFIRQPRKAVDLESPIWARRINKESAEYEVSFLTLHKGRIEALTVKAYRQLSQLFPPRPAPPPIDEVGHGQAFTKSPLAVSASQPERVRRIKHIPGNPNVIIIRKHKPAPTKPKPKAAKKSLDAPPLEAPTPIASNSQEPKESKTPFQQRVQSAKRENKPQSRRENIPTALELAFSKAANTESGSDALLKIWKK